MMVVVEVGSSRIQQVLLGYLIERRRLPWKHDQVDMHVSDCQFCANVVGFIANNVSAELIHGCSVWFIHFDSALISVAHAIYGEQSSKMEISMFKLFRLYVYDVAPEIACK